MDKFIDFDRKLESFIDKFYRISILKGIILFVILCGIILLAISSLEFIGWFSNSIRLFLLLFGLISSLFIFSYFLLIPFLRYFGFLKRLTARKTEQILRENLPHIKDYVLNIIELRELDQNLTRENELLIASITQKIEFTSKIDFQKVLTPKKLYPLIKYFLSILILYISIFFLQPAIFSEGSNRILHFNKVYNKNVGYTIFLNENQLVVEKGLNLKFSVSIEGEKIPDYLSYFVGNNEFLMTKRDNRNYTSTINSINKSFSFRVGNEEFKTPLYYVKVVQPPFLNNFSITIKYPEYTSKNEEVYEGISNIRVPIGSNITWRFSCLNVKELFMKLEKDSALFNKEVKLFYFDSTYYSANYYSVVGINENMVRELVPKSFISVIPDLYPDISLIQLFDENNRKLAYFKGHIFDDYGFKNLVFVVNNKKIVLPFNPNINNQDFFYSYEFDEDSASEFNYYFEVFDNDAVNGSKSSKSNQYVFTLPDYLELAKFKDIQDKEIFDKMEKSVIIADEIQKDIENIRQKLFSEKLSSFEKQQLITGLKSKQDVLEKMLNEFSVQNQKKNLQFDSFNDKNVELLKKQEEIQKLLDSIMTDELKALLDELEKLSLEFNKNDLNKKLDKLELNYNQITEQLDKNLELLKKYEIEKNLEIISAELYKISENQNLLADDNSINSDSLISNNSNTLNELEKQYNSLFNENKELENPYSLENLESEFQELSDNLNQSNFNQQLGNKEKKSKFSENSKKAKDLSEKISDMINNNRVKESGENGETLRQILENLLYFSFIQENINENFIVSSKNNPKYFENVKNQNNLTVLYSIIKDSLLALSKRTPELGSHISRKVYGLESSLFDIDIYLKEYNLSMCTVEQRKVIELSNDLILLLSESLKNMENSGEGSEGSQKNKNKPKQSKPSLAEMRKSQENLKSQLEGMLKKMKDGKPGSGKPTSEQLGKMLAQQEIFQQMINQLQNSSGVGGEFQKKLNDINKLLEQNKRDLIKSNIDQATLFRQNQIVTRLLEAEKSEMERDLDEERKAKEADNYVKRNPEEIFRQENMNINFNDILNSNSIKLNYFYKNKYQEYIKNLN